MYTFEHVEMYIFGTLLVFYGHMGGRPSKDLGACCVNYLLIIVIFQLWQNLWVLEKTQQGVWKSYAGQISFIDEKKMIYHIGLLTSGLYEVCFPLGLVVTK